MNEENLWKEKLLCHTEKNDICFESVMNIFICSNMRASCYVQFFFSIFRSCSALEKENNIFAKRAINYFYFKIHGDIWNMCVDISTYMYINVSARILFIMKNLTTTAEQQMKRQQRQKINVKH